MTEEEKDKVLCALCSHPYGKHIGKRDPHNTKCIVANCICGRFTVPKGVL